MEKAANSERFLSHNRLARQTVLSQAKKKHKHKPVVLKEDMKTGFKFTKKNSSLICERPVIVNNYFHHFLFSFSLNGYRENKITVVLRVPRFRS